jgi:glycosyltransferase involved in cell wall biosynthesis
MIHLFVDASAASSGSGPTYVRNIVPHLAARSDLRSTILISPLLRHEFRDESNVSFVEFTGKWGNAASRFLHVQRLVPDLVRRSGANVLLSAGNIAQFRSPVPQILLSGNALYTSTTFFRDVLRRGHYGVWLDTKLKGYLAKRSVRAADCTVVPSEAFAEEVKHWTGVRARAIHHGFDRNLFFNDAMPLPEELQAKLHRKNDELRLLFVSHYNYYRNFETLFRALPLLRREIKDREVKLFLTCRLQPGANPGSYRPDTAAELVQRLGIATNVVELGSVPYNLVHHVYQACDVYVSPAYVETFAHPLVEAMASGLPIVTSDLAVHREICGQAAVYFPFWLPEALAKQIASVATNGTVTAQLSSRGLERSKEFSWEKHLEQIVAVAAELVSGQRKRKSDSP